MTRLRFRSLGVLISIFLCVNVQGAEIIEPDWSEGIAIPEEGRANIYQLPEDQYRKLILKGKVHALNYPVDVTGILLPFDGFERFFKNNRDSWLQKLIGRVFGSQLGFQSVDDIESWLGLYSYPEKSSPLASVEKLPLDMLDDTSRRMGSSLINRHGVNGLTYSCGACHVGELFGEKVLGMPTRFPRANLSFKLGKSAMGLLPRAIVNQFFRSTPEEEKLIEELDRNIKATGGRYPQVLGLDTSLAHVALSLAHRSLDEYATKDARWERFPRFDMLKSQAADSKPGTWWLLKYKNRWLSDGSIRSGNPIFTNILWNEIGRGTDLFELERWLEDNQTKVQELTAAVFSIQAPRYEDFFPAESIELATAKKGHKLFSSNCSRCHGEYEKAWDQPNAATLSLREQLQTTKVKYFEQTPVVDVGTDRLRRQGMASLEQLNDLAISRSFGTIVKESKGYVPPPLVGVWARWPYFHNNSAPSLCAVLTKSEHRPKRYTPVEAMDRNRDFDRACNGYPLTRSIINANTKTFDSRKQGLGNQGHDEGIFLRDGEEIYTADEKMAIIHFLQTL